jgi:hypothetical protein
MVFTQTVVTGVLLTIIRRGGVAAGLRRLGWVAEHLGESPDREAIRTPWRIVAAVAWISYLWLWALAFRGSG